MLARIAAARPSAGLTVALGRCVQLLMSGFNPADNTQSRADHASVVARLRAARLGETCRAMMAASMRRFGAGDGEPAPVSM